MSEKISALSQISQASVVPGVFLPVVDPNDLVTTPNGPAGSNKQLRLSQLPLVFRVFPVDAYGADPTGATLSDSAFTAAYAAAAASIIPSVSGGPTAGAVVVYGPGVYKHSVNVVKISDPRIGLRGAGKMSTMMYTTGSTGDLVYATDTSPGRAGVTDAAPVGGFSLFGWDAGANTNGLHYGDRPGGTITDITVSGFIATGSSNYLFRNDNGGLSEGTFAVLDSQQGTVGYNFDGSSANGSFDYGTWLLHGVSTTIGGASVMFQMMNQAHMFGGQFALRGNIQSANAGVNATAMKFGVNTSDTARLVANSITIALECDASTGTVNDIVATGTSSAGLQLCHGIFTFLNSTGSFTAGSVGGSALISGSGMWSGPLFSSLGTKTALGTSSAGLVTYVS
jgi:hypothetical protein